MRLAALAAELRAQLEPVQWVVPPPRRREVQNPEAWSKAGSAIAAWRYHIWGVTAFIWACVHKALCQQDLRAAVGYTIFLMPGLLISSACVFGALHLVSHHVEAWIHVVCMYVVVITTTVGTVLNPGTTQSAASFMLAICPISAVMNHTLAVYFHVGFSLETMRPRAWYTSYALLGTVCTCRMITDPEMRPTLLNAVVTWIIVIASFYVTEYTRTELVHARGMLAEEVRRTQETKKQVEMVGQGMSRMLTAMCDVVVHLDEELRILQPSLQLCDVLLGGCSGPSGQAQISGRSLLDFMASDADAEKLRSTLCPAEAAPRSSEGAAAALHLLMKDAAGNVSNAELFYVRLGGVRERSGGTEFLLGFRIAETLAMAPPDAECPDIPDDDTGEFGVDTQFQDARSEESEKAHSDRAASASDCLDPSRIALPFDAGSRRMNFTTTNLLTKVGRHYAKPEGLMQWVSPPQSEAFEKWILQAVHESAWDHATISQPFEGRLTLHLPRVRRRIVHVNKAWLEVQPMDGRRVPATLWLEGFEGQAASNLGGSRGALEPVQEAGFDEAQTDEGTEVAPYDSVSMVSSVESRSVASARSGHLQHLGLRPERSQVSRTTAPVKPAFQLPSSNGMPSKLAVPSGIGTACPSGSSAGSNPTFRSPPLSTTTMKGAVHSDADADFWTRLEAVAAAMADPGCCTTEWSFSL